MIVNRLDLSRYEQKLTHCLHDIEPEDIKKINHQYNKIEMTINETEGVVHAHFNLNNVEDKEVVKLLLKHDLLLIFEEDV